MAPPPLTVWVEVLLMKSLFVNVSEQLARAEMAPPSSPVVLPVNVLPLMVTVLDEQPRVRIAPPPSPAGALLEVKVPPEITGALSLSLQMAPPPSSAVLFSKVQSVMVGAAPPKFRMPAPLSVAELFLKVQLVTSGETPLLTRPAPLPVLKQF